VEVPRELYLDKSKAPAILLGIGDLVWKTISALGNFDFIFSMREERLAMIFESLLKWGWLIILGWAIFRYLKSPRRPGTIYWEMVIYVGIIAFMSGSLLATWGAGSEPLVNIGEGDFTLNTTYMDLDTTRLVGYADRYKVVVAWVWRDPQVDMYEETHLAISNPFTITGGTLRIVTPFRGTTLESVLGPNYVGQISGLFFLFPKDENPKDSIKRLSDVPKYRGILFTLAMPRPPQ
jgi:hypothetical protein